MTHIFFQNLLLQCYTSDTEYCLETNISGKILLNVDNSDRHPPFVYHFQPNIKMVFLQPSLIWPKQWIKALQQLLRPTTWRGPLLWLLLQLKRTLRRHRYNSGMIATFMNSSRTLFGFGVLSPRSECINGIWKKTLKRCIRDVTRFAKNKQDVKNKKHCRWSDKQL